MSHHPRLPGRTARRRTARLAAATAAVAATAALLSGCGIRDTALPVDAGQGASRTACPPAPGVSLSQLDRDAYSSPAAVWVAPTAAPALISPSASPSPTTTPGTPGPAGTLSCLQPSAPESPTPTAVPSGAPSP